MPNLLATYPSTARLASLWFEGQVRGGADPHRGVCVRTVAPTTQVPQQDCGAAHQQVTEDPFRDPIRCLRGDPEHVTEVAQATAGAFEPDPPEADTVEDSDQTQPGQQAAPMTTSRWPMINSTTPS